MSSQGIIRRVEEDGPDRGNVDLDILPRSVRYRLRDVMDDVRPPHCSVQAGRPGGALAMHQLGPHR